MKIIDYIIVQAPDAMQLITLVRRELSLGYQPIGGVAFNPFVEKSKTLAQAMVKYEGGGG